MRSVRRLAAVAAILGATAAHAESSYEFWPELDAFLTLNSRARVFLLATRRASTRRAAAASRSIR